MGALQHCGRARSGEKANLLHQALFRRLRRIPAAPTLSTLLSHRIGSDHFEGKANTGRSSPG